MPRTVTLTLSAEQADTILDALQEASERAETEAADVFAPLMDEILAQTDAQYPHEVTGESEIHHEGKHEIDAEAEDRAAGAK